MPERGWWTLTIRKPLADLIRQAADAHGLTVSQYLERLLREQAERLRDTEVLEVKTVDLRPRGKRRQGG